MDIKKRMEENSVGPRIFQNLSASSEFFPKNNDGLSLNRLLH